MISVFRRNDVPLTSIAFNASRSCGSRPCVSDPCSQMIVEYIA